MREDTILSCDDHEQGQTKRREQAPALRCTDIFLCIYCEFRICLTNASDDAHTPISNSQIRASPIGVRFLNAEMLADSRLSGRDAA